MELSISKAVAFIRSSINTGKQVAAFETLQIEDFYTVQVLFADTIRTINWIEDGEAPGNQKLIGVFSKGHTGNIAEELSALEKPAPEPCAMTFIKQEKQCEMRL
jgi:hypothetical protein